MKEENKVKVEKYKGVDIYYSKEDGQLYFEFEGIDCRAKYIFEARQTIDEPRWEPCDLQGYFIDGTFSDYIGKATATERDIKSQQPHWKLKGKYKTQYEFPSWSNRETKVFLRSKANDAVYKQFEEQTEKVATEERKLKSIIQKLS